jgi:hypothetical protein
MTTKKQDDNKNGWMTHHAKFGSPGSLLRAWAAVVVLDVGFAPVSIVASWVDPLCLVLRFIYPFVLFGLG